MYTLFPYTTLFRSVTFGKSKGACSEAIDWLHTQDDAEQAWQTCERPDWMIWYARRRGVEHKRLVRIACDRSEEHTSELQSLMLISDAVFCLKKTNIRETETTSQRQLI